jgi:hypothetical protein
VYTLLKYTKIEYYVDIAMDYADLDGKSLLAPGA